MSVFSLRVGDGAKITDIAVRGAAEKRLASLGFHRGAEVTVLGFSLFKSCVLLGIGHTRVAVRRSVAEGIEVDSPACFEPCGRRGKSAGTGRRGARL